MIITERNEEKFKTGNLNIVRVLQQLPGANVFHSEVIKIQVFKQFCLQNHLLGIVSLKYFLIIIFDVYSE